MKVITRKVIIENEEFILVEIEQENKLNLKYGTINYKDTYDEDGQIKLARQYNGLDFCLGATIEEAIEERSRRIKLDKFIKENNIDVLVPEDAIKYLNYVKTLLKGTN